MSANHNLWILFESYSNPLFESQEDIRVFSCPRSVMEIQILTGYFKGLLKKLDTILLRWSCFKRSLYLSQKYTDIYR